MEILVGAILAVLVLLLLVIFGSLLFPSGVGVNDGRCGEDLKVSKARASAVRSAWFDL